MAMVAADTSRITQANVRCRPIRSPRWPKKTPPSGRTTNATPKTANELSREVAGSAVEKKTAPMVVAR
jgi:hypothetical protein